MNIEILADQNPWWRNPGNIETDVKIQAYNSSVLKWDPRIKHFIKLDKDVVYTIRGPRQVGKTTLIKMIIKELLENKTRPRDILYFSCDRLRGHEDLIEMIETFLEFSGGIGKVSRRFLFIDEISSVKDWQNAVKHLVDIGKLRNCSVILTGSHSIDIKKSAERLPGRRGESGDPVNKILVPMKFSEYVDMMAPEIRKESQFFFIKAEDRKKMLFNLFDGKIDTVISHDLPLYGERIRTLLDNYLLTGGIMLPSVEHFNKEDIGDHIYEIYIRALIGDLARWKYSENIIKQVLSSIIKKMTTCISMNSIAKENEIGSHNTVSNYLEALEESYVLTTLYKMDPQTKCPVYRKDRKVYIANPFIYHALNGWVQGSTEYYPRSLNVLMDTEVKSNLIEMVVHNHLVRCAFNITPSDVFSPHERLMFFIDKKGREVDFILKHDDKLYPVEVKYRRKVEERDVRPIKFLRNGLVITKGTMKGMEGYSMIPVEYFLMLI